MTTRERIDAVLHYRDYDRLPLVHFGYWSETLEKWAKEGHISVEEAKGLRDGNEIDYRVSGRLGFDCDWQTMFYTNGGLEPAFEPEVVEEFPDGSRHVLDHLGVVILQRPGAGGIPAEIEHTCTDRASFEEHYRHRYQWSESRVNLDQLNALPADRDTPLGLHCGSLYGHIREVLGVIGISYLAVDDEALYHESIDMIGDVCYRNTKYTLEYLAENRPDFHFDFAHFWEDICFKTGPLVNPAVFSEGTACRHRWCSRGRS